MPKIKTHKGAKKRFKFTGTGKVVRHSSHTGHLFTNKSAKRKRNLRKSKLVDKTDERRIKRLMPYS
jgi:large subunit ribosomal protein L35